MLGHVDEMFGPIQLVDPHHFLLKCLYQARKVNGHVFVSGVPILPLSTIFLLQFGQCGILFHHMLAVPSIHFVTFALVFFICLIYLYIFAFIYTQLGHG